MSKEFKKRFISLLLSLDILVLAGCANKVNCEIEGKHMHVYTSEQGIDRYIDSENEYVTGFDSFRYNRTDNYIELDDTNIDYYTFISKHGLVNILDNYDELIYFQSNLRDYYEFEYEYEQSHVMPIGKSFTFYYSTEYDWTSNPNHSDLTGKKRIITHVYYGYNIITDSKGKYRLQKSGPVRDIDLLIQMGYTYVSDEIVSEMKKDEYLKIIGLSEDSDEYLEVNDGEKVELILK